MPTLPWRFQADVAVDNPDPDVTVFIGDSVTNDVTGEKVVHQDTRDPVTVKLSELPAYMSTAMANGVTRAPSGEPQATAKTGAKKK